MRIDLLDEKGKAIEIGFDVNVSIFLAQCIDLLRFVEHELTTHCDKGINS